MLIISTPIYVEVGTLFIQCYKDSWIYNYRPFIPIVQILFIFLCSNTDITERVNDVLYSVATSNAKSSDVYDRAFEAKHNAENILVPKLHDIKAMSMDGVDKAIEDGEEGEG